MIFSPQRFSSEKFLTGLNRSPSAFWLSFSLIVPLYFGLISLHHALSQPYIVQDDARQYVVWLQQFRDPQLFPHDLIAHYFQTVAPDGYKFLYWIMAKIGIAPILFAKVLPIVLGFVTTIYLFKTAIVIMPVPMQAFLTTLIFNQHLWLNDDLISATPRAFVYPFFSAFLYYLLKRSLIPCLMTIALQGLFFPQIMLVAIAVLTVRLFRCSGRFIQLSKQREDYLFWICGVAIALMVILPFVLNISEFGAAITAAQMKAMPEYGWNGRSKYFGVNPLSFLFNGASGLRIPWFPSIILAGFGLPILLKSQFPLVRLITKEVQILSQVILASLSLFVLAHLLLLRLHFPSRYTYHSFRFVLAIAAGIVLTVLLDSGWHWLQQKLQKRLQKNRQTNTQFQIRELILIGLVGIVSAIVIIVPAIPQLFFLFQGWVIGDAAPVYEYLAQQPKQTLVASLATEANNLPAFSQRSTFVGREFALAHHPKYYRHIQQRAIDTIHLQYSPDLSEVKRIIVQDRIDFILIERAAFDSHYLLRQDWLIQSSFSGVVVDTVAQLERGETPAIAQLVDRCAVVSTEQLILLKTTCIQ